MKYYYIRPTRDISEAAQLSAGVAAGYNGRVWVEGKDGTLQALVKRLRRGDTIAFFDGHLLATPRRNRRDQPRTSLRDVIADLCAKGIVAHDVSSGLRSDNPRDKIKMIFAAVDELSRGGRKLAGRDSVGRPRKIEFATDSDKELALAMWESTKYKSREQAMAAIKKRFWPHVDALSITTGYRLSDVPVKDE